MFFFKQKTADEMRISDWSSDVCSSDLVVEIAADRLLGYREGLGEAADGDEAAALQQAEDALMPRRDAVPGVAGAGAAAARISCQRHDWPPAFFLPVQEWPLPFSFGSLPAMPYSASRRSISCRSEEHTSELQSLMRISYAVFCLKKKKK